MMFLDEPFELDVENQGGRVAGLLCAASEIVARRAPLLGSIVGSVVGGLVARLFSRPPEGSRFHPAGILMSIVGATVVVFLVRLVS